MTQNGGIEVVFEISTFSSDKAALICTLMGILDSQLDTYNCCPECFTFVPPFQQKVSGNYYQGSVTARLQDISPPEISIAWNEYIQSKASAEVTAIRTGSQEI
jgi:hypothetical protein